MWGSQLARYVLLLHAAPITAGVLGGLSMGKVSGGCRDEASCKAHIEGMIGKLDELQEETRGKQLTVQALEEIRAGILSGRRVELPSAHRQHLEKGSPLINEVTFDARHRPVSTNVSRHFQLHRSIASGLDIRHHAFLSLKRASPGASKNAIPALLVLIDSESKLSIFSLENEPLLSKFNLGHAPGTSVVQMELSPTQENHFVMTVDDAGTIRVHNIKIISKKKDKTGDRKNQTEEAPEKTPAKPAKETRQLNVSASLASSFNLSSSATMQSRKLIVALPIERGSQTFFVAGDSFGGISVFHRNGTVKGRVRVTEDPGGVKGLIRAQGNQVLFFSSHSFGFFSPSQVDLQYPPCTGWNSPLVDLALEPGYSTGRVLLSLADGDVLVYATTRGKSKACDLTLKFPHVSTLPFKLHSFRGHVMALPTPLEGMAKHDEYVREVFFFNMAAMENGYGSSPSRAITLQASFKPKQPESLALFGQPSAGAGPPGEKAKSQIAIRFEGQRGVEVFDLTLRTPPPPKAAQAEGAAGTSGSGWDTSSLLNWMPKFGVFGIALVGVVIWNIRKVSGGGSSDASAEDFDEELFKEKLRERRAKAKADNQNNEDKDEAD
eukprot:TRINITY_DN17052_c0_g1_i1.p1 TRINITY_DN17052_c0_g1~~TRINITY_DN17052_c0_g1_i1.p1  ORF type:complete len:607 (+),score=114.38 TRINITY_DN17052_c0_g1_i1:114-1934(+)